MTTREEAAEYVRLIEASHGPRDRRLDDARTIVALYDEVERLRRELAACEKVRDAALVEADDAAHGEARMKDERDAARLELRRLRAAEAPGTDDEAVAPWESVGDEERPIWRYWLTGANAFLVSRRHGGWGYFDGTKWIDDFDVALDAMRAAVPGSV